MLTGTATKAYDHGRVQPGDDIPTIKELSPFLGYFKDMHSTACTNRYPDHRGHKHHVKGTTTGGDDDDFYWFLQKQQPAHRYIPIGYVSRGTAVLAGLLSQMIRTFMPNSRQPSKCWSRFANGLERTRNCVST